MKTLEKEINCERKESGGFTRTELLAIIATSAMLAVLLLPAVARGAGQSQGAKCLNNIRQLILAAQMYATDNGGIWFPNQPGQLDWVTDFEDWATANPANTNWQILLAAPGSPLAVSTGCSSFFTAFIKDPSVYKCPADPSMVGNGARIRSYSASQAIGTCWSAVNAGQNCLYGDQNGSHVTGQWLTGEDNNCQDFGFTYQKLTDMVHPPPSSLWVFAEEHPDSINDSTLAVQIGEYQLGGAWIDIPSNLHNGAGSFSFADGHAEIHKWAGRLMSTLTYVQDGDVPEINYEGAGQPPATTAADLKDLNWVQARTSYPINIAGAPRFPSP